MKFDYTRELLVVGLILGRIVPMIFLTPFMAGQQAPPEVKMSLGVLFTILVWPLARDSMTGPVPFYALPFLLLMLKETLIGLAVGFANSQMFYAMETAGRFIDTARGAAMSEVLVPTSRTRATPIGTMYSQLLLCVFVAIGGHHIFMDTFFMSFATIPVNETIDLTPGLAPFVLFMLRLTGNVLMTAVILSAPAIAATFITDLVFGILNRVAPQLNAYFMAMPVKAMGALILILASMTPFVMRLEYYITDSLVAVQKTIQLLKHG
jgi:flagellar biosynthetic protein FliR